MEYALCVTEPFAGFDVGCLLDKSEDVEKHKDSPHVVRVAKSEPNDKPQGDAPALPPPDDASEKR